MLTAPPDSFELFINTINWSSERPIVDICTVSLTITRTYSFDSPNLYAIS